MTGAKLAISIYFGLFSCQLFCQLATMSPIPSNHIAAPTNSTDQNEILPKEEAPLQLSPQERRRDKDEDDDDDEEKKKGMLSAGQVLGGIGNIVAGVAGADINKILKGAYSFAGKDVQQNVLGQFLTPTTVKQQGVVRTKPTRTTTEATTTEEPEESTSSTTEETETIATEESEPSTKTTSEETEPTEESTTNSDEVTDSTRKRISTPPPPPPPPSTTAYVASATISIDPLNEIVDGIEGETTESTRDILIKLQENVANLNKVINEEEPEEEGNEEEEETK